MATFYPGLTSLQVLAAKAHFKIPKDRPFGPILKGCDWDHTVAMAKDLRMAADNVAATSPAAQPMAEWKLSRAYQSWSNVAEVELCRFTDTPARRSLLGGKGQGPCHDQGAPAPRQEEAGPGHV